MARVVSLLLLDALFLLVDVGVATTLEVAVVTVLWALGASMEREDAFAAFGCVLAAGCFVD